MAIIVGSYVDLMVQVSDGEYCNRWEGRRKIQQKIPAFYVKISANTIVFSRFQQAQYHRVRPSMLQP